MRPFVLGGLSTALIFVLSACGGGGGGGGASIPSGPAAPTPSQGPAFGTASFMLAPDSTSSVTGTTRRTRYVSTRTASLAIVVNGAGSAALLNLNDPASCDASKKCSISLAAPAGTDTFVVSAYDGSNGQGNLLSRATVQATIAANTTSIVTAVLSGAASTVTLALSNANPTLHHVLTDTLTVTAKDASGAIIVGPGGFLYPITLTDSDTSGHSSLTNATLNGPGDTTALQYDGGYASGTISATAEGVKTPGTLSFSPSIATTETALPSGHSASGIVVGPDGALWFLSLPGAIGRITTGGSISEFPVPGWNPVALCAGPDGAIWFTASNSKTLSGAIMRRNDDGTFTSYPSVAAQMLVAGPDGNLWAAGGSSLSRITTAGVTTTQTLRDSGGSTIPVDSLAVGPDGALWMGASGALARYDIGTQTIAVHPVQANLGGTWFPETPQAIVVGPDSRLYFNAFLLIMSSDVSGNLASVLQPIGGIGYSPLTFASDGSLWFSNAATIAGNPLWGRIVGTNEVPLTGSTGMPNVFPPAAGNSMVSGPDGALWYARGTVIGRMVP